LLKKSEFIALDAASTLSGVRQRFSIPDGVIYMNGNSLGAMPKSVGDSLSAFVEKEWGQDLIRSWNVNGWYVLASQLGEQVSRLIGAAPDEVIFSDSTSVNLYKLVVTALNIKSQRKKIITDTDNFPTDLYILEGVAKSFGRGIEIEVVDRKDVIDCIDRDTALLTLTQANYRTSELYDLQEVSKAAHRQGALVLWDLSHSCGAMPIDLNGANVDLATGCGYKYLNGGPGAPAFLYVAKRWQEQIDQPLTGWMGHKAPFAMSADYVPAEGITQMLTGTPPIASAICLREGLSVFDGISLTDVRAASMEMGKLFIELTDDLCRDYPLSLVSPVDGERRGSHIALRHENAYALMQELIANGVIGDFRAADIMRFAFTPLYLRYIDVWHAVAVLRTILETESWNKPEYATRAAVT
jgi:kynureninase